MAFPRIRKYVMDRLSSADLDTPLDWAWCEFLIEKGYVSF
jgi:N-acylneuraminate cytidylyltransferase